MHSMTGYGQAQGRVMGQGFTVQIRSVNHRFLDIKIRLPVLLDHPAVEQMITQVLRSSIKRGSIQVTVQLHRTEMTTPALTLQNDMCKQYGLLWLQVLKQCRELEPNVSSRVSGVDSFDTSAMVGWVLQQKDVVVSAQEEMLSPQAEEEMASLFRLATLDLLKSRQLEGLALAKVIKGHVSILAESARLVEEHCKDLPRIYQDRLMARLQRLLPIGEHTIDPQRLAHEVALFATHVDIQEELARLQIHLEQVQSLCDKNDSVGKQLDFFVQEIHREINTLGSKSQSAEITTQLIVMKTELERIREQIQNVE